MSVHENGRIAQLVEQRIENPRVPGSIPGSATNFYPSLYKLPDKIFLDMIRIEQCQAQLRPVARKKHLTYS